MSTNVDNTNADNTASTPVMDSLYKIGDIVIINSNGGKRKRHIYGNPYWEKSVGGIDTWKYPVDYGLGLTSEGVITEGQIIRKSKSGPPSEGGDDNICL
tara:strand:- start:2111 stop:2407 length:297 start_codon:yes stop_codon:yes gene_type:complete